LKHYGDPLIFSNDGSEFIINNEGIDQVNNGMLLDYIQNADITIMSKPSVKFSFTNDSHRFAIQTEQGVEVRDINSGKLFTYSRLKI
jgi:hypothetical protein